MAGHNEDAVRFVVVRFHLDNWEAEQLQRELEEEKEGVGGGDNFGFKEILEVVSRLFPGKYHTYA